MTFRCTAFRYILIDLVSQYRSIKDNTQIGSSYNDTLMNIRALNGIVGLENKIFRERMQSLTGKQEFMTSPKLLAKVT